MDKFLVLTITTEKKKLETHCTLYSEDLNEYGDHLQKYFLSIKGIASLNFKINFYDL